MIEDYIRYLGNLRWTSLGFTPLYEDNLKEPESMRWVSQYSNANMVKTDFFEAKSTAYAKVQHWKMICNWYINERYNPSLHSSQKFPFR